MGVTLAVSTFPLKKSSFLRFSLMSFSQFSAALYRLSSPMMGTPSASTSCTLSLLFVFTSVATLVFHTLLLRELIAFSYPVIKLAMLNNSTVLILLFPKLIQRFCSIWAIQIQ